MARPDAPRDFYANKIGVIGGGQLALMLGEALPSLNQKEGTSIQMVFADSVQKVERVGVTSYVAAPAARAAMAQLISAYNDPESVIRLAQIAHRITGEIEHIPTGAMRFVRDRDGVIFRPGPETYEAVQDKYLQKVKVSKAGIPVAPFKAIHEGGFRKSAGPVDIIQTADELGWPVHVKGRKGAYDGRKNRFVKDNNDAVEAALLFEGEQVYVEKHVPFVRELAIMVAKDENGQYATHPVVETIHVNNICDTVIAPARTSDVVRKRARDLAIAAVDVFDDIGMFGVEMFELPNGDVLYNEMAPRPHNSGHYTIEACETS